MDQATSVRLPPSCPLQIVSSFRYLGVIIQHPMASYVKTNLDPLIGRMKTTFKTWANLPLTLLGRINIFKMIFLPRFLYVLGNSPVYVTKNKFKEIDSILTSFLWGGGAVRIAKDTLQLPVLEGGLALPCLQMYYIASQLAHVHWWFYPEANNAATALEAAILTSYESLQNLIHRMSLGGREGTSIIAMTLRIIKLTKLQVPSSSNTYSPNTPLWGNPNLPEFFRRSDGGYWSKRGVKTILHLFSGNVFRTFEEFRRDYNLPRTAYFLYLQIRHTAATQFGLRNIVVQLSRLERLLTDPSHTKLVSTYYGSLLHTTTQRLSKAAASWRADIPELTEEIWQEVLPLQVPSVISSRDKVIQTKLLYRSYFTPCLLFKLSRIPSALCSRCGAADGTFFHMMWECAPIRKFWSEVTAFISSLTEIPNICNPLRCLLGHIDDETISKNMQTFLRIVLFYAKKSITFHWKSPSLPTITFWLTTINRAIPLYKMTYEARGCPKKFLKVWGSWVDSESTIPPAP